MRTPHSVCCTGGHYTWRVINDRFGEDAWHFMSEIYSTSSLNGHLCYPLNYVPFYLLRNCPRDHTQCNSPELARCINDAPQKQGVGGDTLYGVNDTGLSASNGFDVEPTDPPPSPMLPPLRPPLPPLAPPPLSPPLPPPPRPPSSPPPSPPKRPPSTPPEYPPPSCPPPPVTPAPPKTPPLLPPPSHPPSHPPPEAIGARFAFGAVLSGVVLATAILRWLMRKVECAAQRNAQHATHEPAEPVSRARTAAGEKHNDALVARATPRSGDESSSEVSLAARATGARLVDPREYQNRYPPVSVFDPEL